MQDDDGFDKAFEGFGEDEQPKTPPATPPADPPKDDPAAVEAPKTPEDPKNEPETPKAPEGEEAAPPPADANKEGETPKPPETPATPPAEEAKPLTKEDVTSILSDVRLQERNSVKEIETATDDVMQAYYPEGLSNTLVDQNTGKELKNPQDVVDATNGQMSVEEASQWLMNEQYKLDQEISKIKQDAHKIAENTVNFKRDSVAALQKYEPLFKWQPQLQKKAFDKLMQLVKADVEKGAILSAPDVMDHYDFYLEPYQKAFEYSQQKSATNPAPDSQPPASKPGAEDRLDDVGDGGTSPVNDPNDFAQQVTKELSKGV